MTDTHRIPPYYSPAILTSTGGLDKPNRNGLLYEFRGNYHSDPYHSTVEFLFQLQRHWYAWQHAAMGTPYLDMHDPSGPISQSWSEESGEDSDYWSIDEIIRVILREQGTRAVIVTILHTYAVLNRVLNLLESEGHQS
jgi:hypothetical protein